MDWIHKLESDFQCEFSFFSWFWHSIGWMEIPSILKFYSKSLPFFSQLLQLSVFWCSAPSQILWSSYALDGTGKTLQYEKRLSRLSFQSRASFFFFKKKGPGFIRLLLRGLAQLLKEKGRASREEAYGNGNSAHLLCLLPYKTGRIIPLIVKGCRIERVRVGKK